MQHRLLSPDGLILPNSFHVLPFVGLEDARHKVGRCYENARFSQHERGFCGDPRCEVAKDCGNLLMRDARSGWAWLHFPEKPSQAARELLAAEGWRFSTYRSDDSVSVWRKNGRFALPPSAVPYLDAGRCDYSDERPERMAARAQKKGAEASALYSRARAEVEHIPPGQPVLAGHHSAPRHRAALARHDAKMRAAIDTHEHAESLERRATNSAALHRYQDSAPAIRKRIERTETELRKWRRSLEASRRANSNTVREEYAVMELEEDLALDRATLSACPALPCDTETVEPGDVIHARGVVVLVTRVNSKTYSGIEIEGGAAPWPGKWKHEDLTKVVQKTAVSKDAARQLAGFSLPMLREWLPSLRATLKRSA